MGATLAGGCGSRMERGHPPDADESADAGQAGEDEVPVAHGGNASSLPDAPADAGSNSEAAGAASGGAAGSNGEGAGDAGAGGVGSTSGVGVTVRAQATLMVHEQYGTAQFQLVLSAEPTAEVTIGLESSDPGHAAVKPGALTFTPKDWDVPQVATVVGVRDDLNDGNHSVTIETLACVSDDVRYSGLDAKNVNVLVIGSE